MKFASLVAASPAIAGLTAVSFFFFLRGSEDELGLRDWYENRASLLVHQKDFDRAKTAYRRLEQMSQAMYGTSDADAVYALAYIAEQENDQEEAARQMERLLTIDSKGDARAHRFFSRVLLEELSTAQTEPEGRAIVERLIYHLQAVCEVDGDDYSSRKKLAELLYRLGDIEGAILELEVVARVDLLSGLQVAKLLQVAGRKEEAVGWINRVLDQTQSRLQTDPRDAIAARAASACFAMLGDFERSDLVLSGLEQTPQVLRQRALAHVAWFDVDTESDLQARLVHLRKALELDGANAEALQRFFGLVEEPSVRAEFLEVSETLLLAGGETGSLHFMVGTALALEGDYDRARSHLDLAMSAGLKGASALNNLAWALIKSDGDMDVALELAREAERLDSSDPEIHDTLGQVLVRKGDYQEAVVHLEKALAGARGVKEIHLQLAVCYTNLGNPDLAARHSGIAESINAEPIDEGADDK